MNRLPTQNFFFYIIAKINGVKALMGIDAYSYMKKYFPVVVKTIKLIKVFENVYSFSY